MAANRSLVLGSTEMLVLKLLSEKDMYGYEIIATLKERSNHVFDMKSGTLYPILHSLEEDGCLESYEKEVLGRTRIFYKLTDHGRHILDQKKAEWKEYTCAVNNIVLIGE